MKLPIILFLCFLLLFNLSYTRTAEEWKTRAIYQILTDRFARTHDDITQCTDLSDYCGGTFKGIERNLDYIKNMGYNAIWISPVAKNAPKGYHGYWYINMYEINEHFGSKQDLKDLIDACHEKDIWVMIDVVPNHVAPIPGNNDFSGIYPFNDQKYYHELDMPCKWVDDNDPYNQTRLETCWLAYLPDLNQDDEFVRQTLLDWIRDFVQTFNVDGLRLDATRHIPKWFWTEFREAAGVFTVGEVFNHDLTYCAGYQECIDSLLNFPLRGIFEQMFMEDRSMKSVEEFFEYSASLWKDQDVLGNFVNNHDIERSLFFGFDVPALKAMYAFAFSAMGIPIGYYGDEQLFHGGVDPLNREPLFDKKNPNSEMYQYIKTILTFRFKSEFYKHEQIERVADDSFYAFSRGYAFFAFTNSKGEEVRTVTSHPYEEGTLLCNIFNQKQCIEVKDGKFEIHLINKEAKILFPVRSSRETQWGKNAWKSIKQLWSNNFVSDISKAFWRTKKN